MLIVELEHSLLDWQLCQKEVEGKLHMITSKLEMLRNQVED